MAIYDFFGNEIGIDASGKPLTELKRRFTGKNVIWLGDSIHAYTEPDGITIPELFEYDSGSKCWNWSQGGTTMAKNGVANYDPYSGVGMVDALLTRDFTEQEKYQEDRNFITQVAEMKAFDMAKADYLIIEFGTNDSWKEVPVGAPDSGYDINTTAGALRYMIKQLLTKYPALKIAVCTTQPGKGFLDAEGQKPYNFATQSDAIREVCKNLFIPCIDIYNLSGWNEWTRAHFTYGDPHRNHAGKLKQVQVIEDQMCYFY